MSAPKITFIGAGSTVFVKNILGDVFQRPALKSAHVALMDIDDTRLEESHTVVRKLMDSVGAKGYGRIEPGACGVLTLMDAGWNLAGVTA